MNNVVLNSFWTERLNAHKEKVSRHISAVIHNDNILLHINQTVRVHTVEAITCMNACDYVHTVRDFCICYKKLICVICCFMKCTSYSIYLPIMCQPPFGNRSNQSSVCFFVSLQDRCRVQLQCFPAFCLPLFQLLPFFCALVLQY